MVKGAYKLKKGGCSWMVPLEDFSIIIVYLYIFAVPVAQSWIQVEPGPDPIYHNFGTIGFPYNNIYRTLIYLQS